MEKQYFKVICDSKEIQEVQQFKTNTTEKK